MIKGLEEAFHKIFGAKKIIQFSPPRTGSTLVFNILREALPDRDIEKTHNYKRKFSRYPVIASYRHPLDAIASSIQRYGRTPSDEEIAVQIQEFEAGGIRVILDIRHDKNVLMMRYEDFYHDHDYIYDRLEKFFSIGISAEKRRAISGRYNIDAVNEMVSQFDNFESYHKETQLHGRHISAYKGETNYYKDYFTSQQIAHLKDVYRDILVAFDYE